MQYLETFQFIFLEMNTSIITDNADGSCAGSTEAPTKSYGATGQVSYVGTPGTQSGPENEVVPGPVSPPNRRGRPVRRRPRFKKYSGNVRSSPNYYRLLVT